MPKLEIKDEEEIEVVELLPCPFCGGPVHFMGEAGESWSDIECDGCAYIFYDTSESASWWNTRATESYPTWGSLANTIVLTNKIAELSAQVNNLKRQISVLKWRLRGKN